jgi:hypothetical protein
MTLHINYRRTKLRNVRNVEENLHIQKCKPTLAQALLCHAFVRREAGHCKIKDICSVMLKLP